MKTFLSGRTTSVAAFVLMLCGFQAPARGQLSFKFLEGMSSASAVSADGSVVVGSATTVFYQPNFARWTPTGGAQILPSIPGVPFPSAIGGVAISNDGSVIAGTAWYGTGALQARNQAFRWTESTGTVGLGSLPDRVSSHATGMSGDGSTIVGTSESSLPGVDLYVPPTAVKWTAATGLTSLGFPSGKTDSSIAAAISNDGSTIVGTASEGGGFRMNSSGITLLGGLSPAGVSADGTFIVGSAGFGGFAEPVRWSDANGVTRLGTLPLYSGRGGVATSVSNDGNFILGISYNQFDQSVPFIWTPESGTRGLLDVFTNVYGLSDELQGWNRLSVYGMSFDARFLVGSAYDSQGLSHGWLLDRGIDPVLIPPGDPTVFAPVPEPATYGIIGALALALAVLSHRRRSKPIELT